MPAVSISTAENGDQGHSGYGGHPRQRQVKGRRRPETPQPGEKRDQKPGAERQHIDTQGLEHPVYHFDSVQASMDKVFFAL